MLAGVFKLILNILNILGVIFITNAIITLMLKKTKRSSSIDNDFLTNILHLNERDYFLPNFLINFPIQ